MENNYKILGLEESASKEEIENAYERLEKKYKKDNSKKSKNKLDELNKAYNELISEKTNSSDKEESILNKLTKERIIIFTGGLILGLLIMLLFFPERIAELKSGEQVAVEVGDYNITADDLYNKIKKVYSVNALAEKVDTYLLDKKYTLTEEENKTIADSASRYISSAASQNITEEDFLTSNGFETKEDFLKYLELEDKRSKYSEEYLLSLITDDEVKVYYDSSVYGEINTEHILVKMESSSEDEAAKSLATEILEKLKSGSNWDDLKNEYQSKIVTESVDVEFDSPLESSYKSASEKLTDGNYTTSLVKTSYGYHIIYRKSSKEKEELDKVKDRIKDVLATQKRLENEEALYAKSLINLRSEANMEIKDTQIKKLYEAYIKNVEETLVQD